MSLGCEIDKAMLVRSDTLGEITVTGHGNSDLEPIIPESDDERSATEEEAKTCSTYYTSKDSIIGLYYNAKP